MSEVNELPLIMHRQPWIYDIELTNHCPFKCVMCPRTHSMDRTIGHMPFELFTKFIDSFCALGIKPEHKAKRLIRLHHFGESLVHPEFDRFIRYLADRDFRTAMSINPLMLTTPVAERLLNSGIAKLFCSLDGHDDASFEEIRGVPDAYDKSVRRLEAFLERREELGLSDKIHVELSMIDFARNRDSIKTKQDYWKQHELLDRFRHKTFVRWSGSDAEVNALADDVSEQVFEEQRAEFGACRRPWQHVAVLWDGRVVPCCYDHNAAYVLGDLKRQGWEEIWNGEPMQRLRAEFNAGEVTNPLCKTCAECPTAPGQVKLQFPQPKAAAPA